MVSTGGDDDEWVLMFVSKPKEAGPITPEVIGWISSYHLQNLFSFRFVSMKTCVVFILLLRRLPFPIYKHTKIMANWLSVILFMLYLPALKENKIS